jgi:hypothetical protein
MKPLFSPTDLRFTNDGAKLYNELNAVVLPLFQRWVLQGFSPREMSHLMQQCIMENELEAVLEYTP